MGEATTGPVLLNGRIGTKFKNVISPIDLRELAVILSAEGYRILSPIVPYSSSSIDQIGGAGDLGGKETTVVDVNTEKQVIGVRDNDLAMLASRHRELMDAFSKGEVSWPGLKPWFFEFQGRFVAPAAGSPYAAISKSVEGTPTMKRLGKVAGVAVGLHSLRFSPTSNPPESTEYLEVTIQPGASGRAPRYDALVIKRSETPETIREFALGSNAFVASMIQALEEK